MQIEPKPVKTREGNDERAIIEEARERAAYAWEYWYDQFLEWKADVVFLGGEQWDKTAIDERTEAQRPMLTINTLPQYVDQVMGDILQNRPSIHVSASDSDGAGTKVTSVDGKSNYTLAQAYEGIIRNIEYVSGAESHYDTAVQHAIESGMGWLRVISRYCEGPTYDQELIIRSVRNRWSVLMDPDAQEPDMHDAGWGFIFRDMLHKEFKKRYPDEPLDTLDPGVTVEDRSRRFSWSTQTKIRVAEYFRREAMQRKIVQLTNGNTMWLDDIEKVKREVDGKEVIVNILPELRAEGIDIHAERKIDTYKVLWCLVSGQSILEKETEWPGSTIPIVPVAGKRLDLEDGSLYRGLIHHAKDAKRADNYYITAAVERIGLAPKAPWVLYADEIEGHEAQWNEANRKNFAYLLINPSVNGSRPQRTDPPSMPNAELQMSAVMTDRVKSTIGMYDAALGARSNEQSGRAILARQKESDTSTFAFSDNLSKAIARIGMICTEVIPKIMDGTRQIRLRDRAGKSDWVEFNKTVKDNETGELVIVNDIRAAKMDVIAKAGPSYNTQRQEASEAMLEFVRVVPQAGQIILDKLAASMDWPGADEIAQRLIKMVPPHFLTEREVADNNIQPPPPTPEQEAEMAKQKGIMATAEANMAMAAAKKAEAEAKMAEINQLAAGAPDDKIVQMIRDMVAEALAEVFAAANQQTPAPAPAPAKSNGAKKPATK